MANDRWKTPNTEAHPIITLVLKVMGEIDLDPTADSAKANIPAHQHYSVEDNSLLESNEWAGKVYMNPPFSNPLPFVNRLCMEYEQQNIAEAIVLVKAGTVHNKGTGSLFRLHASAFCFWGAGLSTRIAYLNEDDVPTPGADFDCSLVYLGGNPKLFKNVFSDYGNCLLNGQ